MDTSDLRNGEQPQINSVLPPELSSLDEKFLVEQWLLAAGVVPDSAIDTLLMYAYAQKGIQKVTLEVDRDEAGNGKSPSVTYKIQLEPLVLIKWQGLQKIKEIKSELIKKASLLALAKVGAPIGLEESIIHHAKLYLPAIYTVKVEIKNG